MARIGKYTARKMVEMLNVLINEHLDEIDDAYRNAEDSLSVGFTVKVKPQKHAGNDLDATINFVTARCKDTIKDAVDENQMSFISDNIESIKVGGETVYEREQEPEAADG